MKVKELIEELIKEDQELEVWLADYEYADYLILPYNMLKFSKEKPEW